MARRGRSVGATVWRNLRAGAFAGPVFAVNNPHAALDGTPVHARPADLPEAPDLAVICTPPDTVADLVGERICAFDFSTRDASCHAASWPG